MAKEKEMKELQEQVIIWAKERDLISKDNATRQALKLTEEVGELAGAILKNKTLDQIDAIGDIMVVLTILCEQLNLDLESCFLEAYQTIKNRTGKTVNGTFIKD